MHVVLASIPIIIFTSVVSKTADKQCEYKKIMQWMFWGVTLIVSVMAIGFFEGFITICLKMFCFLPGQGTIHCSGCFPRQNM